MNRTALRIVPSPPTVTTMSVDSARGASTSRFSAGDIQLSSARSSSWRMAVLRSSASGMRELYMMPTVVIRTESKLAIRLPAA